MPGIQKTLVNLQGMHGKTYSDDGYRLATNEFDTKVVDKRTVGTGIIYEYYGHGDNDRQYGRRFCQEINRDGAWVRSLGMDYNKDGIVKNTFCLTEKLSNGHSMVYYSNECVSYCDFYGNKVISRTGYLDTPRYTLHNVEIDGRKCDICIDYESKNKISIICTIDHEDYSKKPPVPKMLKERIGKDLPLWLKKKLQLDMLDRESLKANKKVQEAEKKILQSNIK